MRGHPGPFAARQCSFHRLPGAVDGSSLSIPMGRFDRDDLTAEGLPASLDSATEELRSTVERELREIIEAAEAKAAEIEDRALEQAGQIEQYSQQMARGLLRESIERTDRMLAAIDSFERDASAAIGSLRGEAETLAAKLRAAKPDELPQEPEQSNGYPDEAGAVTPLEAEDATEEARAGAEEQKPSSSRRRRLRRRRAREQQAESESA